MLLVEFTDLIKVIHNGTHTFYCSPGAGGLCFWVWGGCCLDSINIFNGLRRV